MSLRSIPCRDVPAATATIARAAFPHGSPYLRLRDHLGTIFTMPSSRPSLPVAGSRPNARGDWRW